MTDFFVDGWQEIAEQHYRNETFYRDLLMQIGAILGPEAHRADDGSVSDEPLCAKLPEVVRNLVKDREIMQQNAFGMGFIAAGGRISDAGIPDLLGLLRRAESWMICVEPHLQLADFHRDVGDIRTAIEFARQTKANIAQKK